MTCQPLIGTPVKWSALTYIFYTIFWSDTCSSFKITRREKKIDSRKKWPSAFSPSLIAGYHIHTDITTCDIEEPQKKSRLEIVRYRLLGWKWGLRLVLQDPNRTLCFRNGSITILLTNQRKPQFRQYLQTTWKTLNIYFYLFSNFVL